MNQRRDYHRGYYQENSSKLSERRSQANADFELATSYWRQCFVSGRDLPQLIAKVPDSIVERACDQYEAMLQSEYGPDAVEKMRKISTWKRS